MTLLAIIAGAAIFTLSAWLFLELQSRSLLPFQQRKATNLRQSTLFPQARIVSLSVNRGHKFRKQATPSIKFVVGHGVEDDSHSGESQPPLENLNRVYILHSELLTKFAQQRIEIKPGDLGENITTAGIDILSLSSGTELVFVNPRWPPLDGDGEEIDVSTLKDESYPYDDSDLGEKTWTNPCLVVQGLRNSSPQIEALKSGLQELSLVREDGEEGSIVGVDAGVVCSVKAGGIVRVGARVVVREPEVFVPLELA